MSDDRVSLYERAAALKGVADETAKAGQHYEAVFRESSTAGQHVLADLACACGWYDTLPDNASHMDHVAHNARRQVFERVLNLAKINGSVVDGMLHAIRRYDAMAKADGFVQEAEQT